MNTAIIGDVAFLFCRTVGRGVRSAHLNYEKKRVLFSAKKFSVAIPIPIISANTVHRYPILVSDYSLGHFGIQNSGDFLGRKLRLVGCYVVANLRFLNSRQL
jgi:hypothetical protein